MSDLFVRVTRIVSNVAHNRDSIHENSNTLIPLRVA